MKSIDAIDNVIPAILAIGSVTIVQQLINEPSREKTNDVVYGHVCHKLGCTVREAG